MPPNQPQLNNPQLNAPHDDDAVWISREEYDRLRNVTAPDAYVQVKQTEKQLNKQRKWQIILGGLLAAGLYFSVSAGIFANGVLVAMIVLFGLISLYDYRHSRKVDQASGQVTRTPLKGNPYKVLAITLLCVTVLPVLVMLAFFTILLSLGGGDVGS